MSYRTSPHRCLILLAMLCAAPAAAQYRFETDAAACDPALGRVRLGIDAYGAVGTVVGGSNQADFDPADDAPNQGYVSTIYESMAYLCVERNGGADGTWLENGRYDGAAADVEAVANRVTSTFDTTGLAVAATYRLNCAVLEQCYRFTNNTGGVVDRVALTHYVDGDLFFEGNFNNDFGATSVGAPKTLWEFDEGDDPDQPTTFLGLYGLDRQDSRLHSWEIGEYPEQRNRIDDTGNTCQGLRNDINRDRSPSDNNGDLTTDNGYDVTLSLRFDVGPLQPGETSDEICYAVQWGVGLPCSDEDGDEICLPDDNCPEVANPDQADSDGDGIGDACDPCTVQGDEVCDGEDDDCDGQIDEYVGVGDACDTGGVGLCAIGRRACGDDGQASRCDETHQPIDEVCDGQDQDCDGVSDEGLLNACGDCGEPPADVCDGVDDDCDGAVDEGHVAEDCPAEGLGPCGVGRTMCVAGQVVCAPQAMPADEVCNGADDDCDGMIDEGDPGANAPCDTGAPGVCGQGLSRCDGGALVCEAAAQASDEVCDRLDNDCDGMVDEGFLVGGACDTGRPGVCAAGVEACGPDGVTCQPEVEESPELCDGLDNDCDGEADEEAGDGSDCATGEPGRCRVGGLVCLAGAPSCSAREEPVEEVCDGVDDDCDGTIDEGTRNACGRCGAVPAEVCDGVDQDCDGEIDDGAECEDGALCVQGRCAEPCVNNECSGNMVCVQGACLEACEAVQCPDGLDCVDGDCLDACADVDCGAGQVCVAGVCRANRCSEVGCPDGFRCVLDICEPDACADATCDAGEFCRDGACVASCATVSCPLGERCFDGRCQAHPCADVQCADGQVCFEGQCEADPCAGVTCVDAGARCVDGFCLADPCGGVTCGPGEACDVIDGVAQCVGDLDGPDEPEPEPDAGAPAEDAGAPGGGPDLGTQPPPDDVDAGGGGVRFDATPDGDGAVGGGDGGGNADGCACDAGQGSGPGALALLLMLGALRPRRRARR